jgi:hypothetical protein
VSVAAPELSAAERAAMRRRADQISKRVPPPGRPAPSGPGRTPRPLPAPRPVRPAARPARTVPERAGRPSFAAEAGRRAPTTKITRTNYQPVILVEFVAAILLTAASPIATKKNPSGLSPYTGDDMIKLAALTVVYLVLAMLSAAGRGPGRFAAWFGGLILLTVGLAEGASVATTLDLFGLGSATDAAKAKISGGGAPARKKG